MKLDRIKNAIKGGLVLGLSHLEGGIALFFEDGTPHFKKRSNGSFLTDQSEMEGGEYILNYIASAKFQQRLLEINHSAKRNIFDDNIANQAKFIIDARITNKVFLTFENQFIVNARATIKNITELDEINSYGQEMLKEKNI